MLIKRCLYCFLHESNHLPAGDVKKLQGEENYRLRVGDYHIVFNNDGFVLYIIRIDSRGQIYNR